MTTQRMTMAQALIRFLSKQKIERDGVVTKFFGGCFGIFGHGNVAGIGQALQETPELPYFQSKNEQAMVHAAAGYAKMKNRLGALACTTSIGPGATNMITAAAGATINRLPVLLLPGDVFATRSPDPVLQQLEQPWTRDISVNDCFRPVSKYWDRIWRPEQLPSALIDAMRVLTSPADTGAVTLCLPQDVQAEAYDYPVELFEERVWSVERTVPSSESIQKAAELIEQSKTPLIIAGGGVLYSAASDALDAFVTRSKIPISETQAGKGALPWDHAQNLGAVGATGTLAANRIAKDADLIIGIGTRYSDFTTASQTAFQNPNVRFLNINVAQFDAVKQGAFSLIGDARATIEAIDGALGDFSISAALQSRVAELRLEWNNEADRVLSKDFEPPIAQASVIRVLNEHAGDTGVVVCAAGSLPGDLHKLWRPRDPKSYHLEYGYSCMGYEIAGGLGIKMAAPEREVYVMVGDGSYLMMAQEIVTSVQEKVKLNILLLDNHGFSSIGGLSEMLGSQGFGTEYKFRGSSGSLDGDALPIDFAKNAQSLGATVFSVRTVDELKTALEKAKAETRTTVITVETAREKRVPGYDSWWDVPVAEVSSMPSVQKARADWEAAVKKRRTHL